MRTRHYRVLAVALCLCTITAPGIVMAMAEDDPLLVKVMAHELEYRATADEEDSFSWDGEAWLGHSLNKLWVSTEGTVTDSDTAAMELQALYSRAIAAFWDVQIGWRGDFQPGPDRQWLTAGLRGIAPYHFDIDAALFVGESGRTAARLEVDYTFLFTQKLILQPELAMNAYGKDDPKRGIGSGLSEVELGLRLRYEIRREFAPYIGVRWEGMFGETADLAQQAGDSKSELQWLLGLRAWF